MASGLDRPKRISKPTEKGREYAKQVLEKSQRRAAYAFKSDIKSWVQDQEIGHHDDIGPEDSVSQEGSRSSKRSTHTTASSYARARAKEQEHMLELSARASALKERQVLEEAKLRLAMEEAKIRIREEELELNTKMAISNARSLVLDRLETGSYEAPSDIGEKPPVLAEPVKVTVEPKRAEAAWGEVLKTDVPKSALRSEPKPVPMTPNLQRQTMGSSPLNVRAQEFTPAQGEIHQYLPAPVTFPQFYPSADIQHPVSPSTPNDVLTTMIS
jgi:hypothetical protein